MKILLFAYTSLANTVTHSTRSANQLVNQSISLSISQATN